MCQILNISSINTKLLDSETPEVFNEKLEIHRQKSHPHSPTNLHSL